MNLEQQIAEVAPNLNPDVIKIIGQQIKNNTDVMWKLFGFCVTGFFVLSGWMWYLVGQVAQAKSVKKDLDQVVTILKKIESKIIGGYDTKGMITELHENKKEIISLKQDISKLKEGSS